MRPDPNVLPPIQRTIWLLREDIRELCNYDLNDFAVWLAVQGIKEYSGLCEAESQDVAKKMSFIDIPGMRCADAPPVNMFMWHLWRIRPDLQQEFPLTTPASRENYSWWYFLHASRELNTAKYLTPAQIKYLNEEAFSLNSEASLSRLEHRIWQSDNALRQNFDLKSTGSLLSYKIHFVVNELEKRGLLKATPESLIADLKSLRSDSNNQTAPLLALWIWAARPQVRSQFADPFSHSFEHWLSTPSAEEALPILTLVKKEQPKDTKVNFISASSRTPGVNVIGYISRESGIGEDARMVVRSLRAAGVVVSTYDLARHDHGRHSSMPTLADLPHRVNIICTTAIDSARIRAQVGPTLFAADLNIGLWPWETAQWPREWCFATDLVDEIWATSWHTYSAIVKIAAEKSIHVPMAVEVSGTAKLQRPHFGIPFGHFAYLFSFDSLSTFSRKNPLAALRAFQYAFTQDAEVALVIKSMRAEKKNADWLALIAASNEDPRIILIDEILSREEMLDLYRCCDCFVSLHRAEGFGRGIAEAMLLGLPVIATGYSGNLDFNNAATSALVRYKTIDIANGEYPFAEGQVWADPNPSDAARWMVRLRDDRVFREKIAANGREFISGVYNPKSVGRRYRELLSLQLTN